MSYFILHTSDCIAVSPRVSCRTGTGVVIDSGAICAGSRVFTRGTTASCSVKIKRFSTSTYIDHSEHKN